MNGLRTIGFWSLPGYFQSVANEYTTGIYVSGTDVYVAGGERYPINHPLPFHFTGYGKNGLFVDLPDYLTDSNVTTQVAERWYRLCYRRTILKKLAYAPLYEKMHMVHAILRPVYICPVAEPVFLWQRI